MPMLFDAHTHRPICDVEVQITRLPSGRSEIGECVLTEIGTGDKLQLAVIEQRDCEMTLAGKLYGVVPRRSSNGVVVASVVIPSE